MSSSFYKQGRRIPRSEHSFESAGISTHFFQGFRVAKGTIVFPNIWSVLCSLHRFYGVFIAFSRAISRDNISGIPPEEFAPERFLDDCVEKTALDPYSYAFGFGRRCAMLRRRIWCSDANRPQGYVRAGFSQTTVYFYLWLVLCPTSSYLRPLDQMGSTLFWWCRLDRVWWGQCGHALPACFTHD
jgi:hypothetical protein